LITDFQKLSERDSEPIISTISNINKNNISTFDFFKCLLNLRILLKKNNFTSRQRRNILRDFIRIFLFKKLVLKDNSYENFIKKNKVPKVIIKEIESYINIDKKDVNDQIYRQNNILPKRNSNLDKWIKSEFLKEIKKYFRGVVGYKVHARFASNNGHLKDNINNLEKDSDRFKYSYSDFHWDYALNAMPYVIYLNDVKKGDGEFKILKTSINFKQNLYLSSYDYVVSSTKGIRNSIMSNRVGSHLDIKDRKEIENDIRYFEGSKGTSIFFSGRHIIHCGGYPEKGKNRLSVFLSHKNILIAFINNITRIFDLY
tara:strand:- start:404 stop:1345 length:942 start_codon:yes stop_codon:yes gene_type:complete